MQFPSVKSIEAVMCYSDNTMLQYITLYCIIIIQHHCICQLLHTRHYQEMELPPYRTSQCTNSALIQNISLCVYLQLASRCCYLFLVFFLQLVFGYILILASLFYVTIALSINYYKKQQQQNKIKQQKTPTKQTNKKKKH